MSNFEEYREKLKKYRTDLSALDTQVATHRFTKLKLSGTSGWLSARDVEVEAEKIRADRNFLKHIYDSLESNKNLLEKEPDPVEPINLSGIVAGIVGVLLAGAAINAANQKKVYVDGYRKKDGTYVKGHYKTVHTGGAGSILSNSNDYRYSKSEDNTLSEEERLLSEEERLLSEKERLILDYNGLMEKVINSIWSISNELKVAEDYIKDPVYFQQKTIAAEMRAKQDRIRRAEKDRKDRIEFEKAVTRAKQDRIRRAEKDRKDRIEFEKAVTRFFYLLVALIVALSIFFLYKIGLLLVIFRRLELLFFWLLSHF